MSKSPQARTLDQKTTRNPKRPFPAPGEFEIKVLSFLAKWPAFAFGKAGGAAMPTMNISLPESLRDFVEAQVHSGDYASASEFVRTLLRQEQKDREQEQLELRILQGLSDGGVVEVSPEIWNRLRRRLRNPDVMPERIVRKSH
jgi:antitoxin ParD1/3/4